MMFLEPSAFYVAASGRVQADKGPEARFEFGFDWTDILDTAHITAFDWTVEVPGVVESVRTSEGITYAWISGGALGNMLEVVGTVTLSDGRKDSCGFLLNIVRRQPLI
jgi:hypothetical protein